MLLVFCAEDHRGGLWIIQDSCGGLRIVESVGLYEKWIEIVYVHISLKAPFRICLMFLGSSRVSGVRRC